MFAPPFHFFDGMISANLLSLSARIVRDSRRSDRRNPQTRQPGWRTQSGLMGNASTLQPDMETS